MAAAIAHRFACIGGSLKHLRACKRLPRSHLTLAGAASAALCGGA